VLSLIYPVWALAVPITRAPVLFLNQRMAEILAVARDALLPESRDAAFLSKKFRGIVENRMIHKHFLYCLTHVNFP
jgi:hypothetical protein